MKSNFALTHRDRAMNRYDFARAMGKWARKRVRDFLGLKPGDKLTLKMQGCVFFLTMTFDQEQMLPLKASNGHLYPPNPSYEWDQISHFYNLLVARMKRALGPRARLPLLIAGLDFEGTRRRTQTPDAPVGLQIHAILAFDPDQDEVANDLCGTLAFLYRFKLATLTDGLQIRPFDFGKFTIAEAFSYASKGEAVIQGKQEWGLAIRLYDGTQNYRQERRYQPITAAQRWQRKRKRHVKQVLADEGLPAANLKALSHRGRSDGHL